MGVEENKVQSDVLKYLKAHNIFAWRNNSNAQRNRNNSYMVGQGDIIGCLPDGVFLSIEIKTKTGRVSTAQKAFIEEIDNRGGIAIVAHSVEDVETALDYWL